MKADLSSSRMFAQSWFWWTVMFRSGTVTWFWNIYPWFSCTNWINITMSLSPIPTERQGKKRKEPQYWDWGQKRRPAQTCPVQSSTSKIKQHTIRWVAQMPEVIGNGRGSGPGSDTQLEKKDPLSEGLFAHHLQVRALRTVERCYLLIPTSSDCLQQV